MPLSSRRTAPGRYSRAQVILHWTTVGLVFMQLVVNDEIRRAFRDRLGHLDGEMAAGTALHIAGGSLVLVLTLLRLSIRVMSGSPPQPPGTPPLLKLFAGLGHWGLYALLLGMPATGIIAWFGRVEIAGVLHETGRLLLIALILAHVLGALVEHFVIGNRTLRRML